MQSVWSHCQLPLLEQVWLPELQGQMSGHNPALEPQLSLRMLYCMFPVTRLLLAGFPLGGCPPSGFGVDFGKKRLRLQGIKTSAKSSHGLTERLQGNRTGSSGNQSENGIRNHACSLLCSGTTSPPDLWSGCTSVCLSYCIYWALCTVAPFCSPPPSWPHPGSGTHHLSAVCPLDRV